VKADSLDPEEGKAAGLAQREIRTCRACGTKFSAVSEDALCPACVLLEAAGHDSAQAEAVNQISASENRIRRNRRRIEDGPTSSRPSDWAPL
jgi:rubredoxin